MALSLLSRRTVPAAFSAFSALARFQSTAGKYRPEPSTAASLMDIGTRGIFNENHDMFRSMVRKFIEVNVGPYHEKWEDMGQVPRELWLAAGKQGLLNIATPEKYGGSGADILYAAIVWEELGYSGFTGPGWPMHSDIVIPYILRLGTEEQKERLIPPMCSGEKIGALAMTEPTTGSDVAAIRTHGKLDPETGDYIINGNKTFITNGWHADVVIVAVKTDDKAKPSQGISLLLVERGMKGFERGKKLKKMGMKAQDTAELFFDNVRVPKANILGEPNKGFYYLMQDLPQERLIIADIGVAAAESSFEITRSHVKDRKAFGKVLLDQQIIKHRMARMKMEIVAARAFIDQCLMLHSQKRLDTATASMAKTLGSELQNRVADEGVQLHGGWGYMWQYPIARAYVDARVQPIYGGTNEIMMELVGRTL